MGRTNFSIALFNNFRDGWSGAGLSMTGAHAKAHYALIESGHRAEVEARLALLGDLQWQPKPGAKESAIAVFRHVSPADPATWPALNPWLANAMRTMHDLFRPIVKSLDASDWQAPEPAEVDSPQIAE